MAIRSLLAHILGVASRDIPSLPHGDNTAVSKLIFDNGVFSVEYYNDNSHLPPELSTFARQSWWKKETRGADPNNLYYEPLDPNREGETYKEFYAASWKAAHGDLKGFYPETYLASARRHFAANGKAILKAYRSDGHGALKRRGRGLDKPCVHKRASARSRTRHAACRPRDNKLRDARQTKGAAARFVGKRLGDKILRGSRL